MLSAKNRIFLESRLSLYGVACCDTVHCRPSDLIFLLIPIYYSVTCSCVQKPWYCWSGAQRRSHKNRHTDVTKNNLPCFLINNEKTSAQHRQYWTGGSKKEVDTILLPKKRKRASLKLIECHMNIFTSRVSGRGNRIGTIFSSACVSVHLWALSQLDHLTYDLDFWYGSWPWS